MMKIEDLGVKQLIAALGFYNNHSDVRSYSFTEFLAHCKPDTGYERYGLIFTETFPDESSDIVGRAVCFPHGFCHLYEEEEDAVVKRFEELFAGNK